MKNTAPSQIPMPSLSRQVFPSIWRTPMFLPGLSLLPTFLCGTLAIAGWLAPSWIETMIPGYHARYLPIVVLVVCFALLRSVYRLLRSMMALLFFGAATVAIVLTIFPSLSSLTSVNKGGVNPSWSLPQVTSLFQTASSPQSAQSGVERTTPKYRSLPPALPDEAYFPRQKSDPSIDGSGLSGAMFSGKGSSPIVDKFRGMLSMITHR